MKLLAIAIITFLVGVILYDVAFDESIPSVLKICVSTYVLFIASCFGACAE